MRGCEVLNMKRKKMLSIKGIIRNKITVIIAIIAFWAIGSKIQEVQAGYSASVAYQYYLLGTEADTIKESTESTDLPMNLGSLGSGGVSGEFSYDDIVNSAGEENEEQAKQFASIMATYSTFNYFSNKVEGFASILPYFGRWASAIILLPLAVIMDLLSTIVPALVGLIAKLNVVRFLADMLTNLPISSSLADALGVNVDTFKKFTEALLSFAVIMILLTLGKMFQSGGKVDQRNFSKLKGRLFSIIAVPVIIGIGATIIDEVMSLAMSSTSNTSAFSRYLVDDRSWAYNFNFAPNGNDAKDGNISPDNNSSYVDLDFNPYTNTGKKRISKINSQSSLANEDNSKFNFSNSALVLSFVSSESFSAVDYINYKGTKASQHFYGQEGKGNGETFGSYYQYAVNNQDKWVDVENAYNASGSKKPDDKKSGVSGGYKSAIDDYVADGKLIVNPSVAWRDRFIYGAKNSGANIDKYYAEPPSYEQMTNEVGNNKENAFSNQSMFLILSTMFSETGGKYYIDAPSRGIMGMKASFDSNRSNYFVVSMVGNPFFTMFGIISKPIIQLIALCSVILAILSIGLIDMNFRPLSAWIKGSTLGDIEYSYAILVYSVGIAGTILSLIVIPEMFTTVIEYIPTLIDLGLESQGISMHTPQASLAYYGVGLVFQSAVAIILGFLFWKSKTFRNQLVALFTFCWAWAKVTGQDLERQASRSGMRISNEQKRMTDKMNARFGFNQSQYGSNNPMTRRQRAGNWWESMKQGVSDDLGWKPTAPLDDVPTTREQGFDNYESEPIMDAQDIARNGMYERAMMSLQDVEDNVPNHLQLASIEAQEGIMEVKTRPSQENYSDALDRLNLLQNDMSVEGIEQDTINHINLAKEELYNIGQTYGFNISDSNTPPIKNYEGVSDIKSGNDEGMSTTNIFNNQREENHSYSDNRVYKNKEVQQLANTLGEASNDKDIARALEMMNSAKNNTDVQRGLSKLQESIGHLDIKDREKIDTSELSKSLDKVMDLNK